jgi:hypothetical protein
MDERSGQERVPEPLRLAPPLSQLPWDVAQSQFGVQGADFIGVFGTLLLRTAQSQFKAYVSDNSGHPDTLPPIPVQSQLRPAAEWIAVGE